MGQQRPYEVQWHPILAAIEQQPGVWHMITPTGRVYAVLQLVDIGGERGYRAVTWAERSEDRQLIGYFTSLRACAFTAHKAWLGNLGPQGFAPSPWSIGPKRA